MVKCPGCGQILTQNSNMCINIGRCLNDIKKFKCFKREGTNEDKRDRAIGIANVVLGFNYFNHTYIFSNNYFNWFFLNNHQ